MKDVDIASLVSVLSVAVPLCIGAGIVAVGFFVFGRRRLRPLKFEYFQEKWNEIQKMCANKDSWPQVVRAADSLLDEALKKRRIRGKTMGERLVKVQRSLSDNDGVWFGHKLRNKIETDPDTRLKEVDVKDALVGIRQALKDLGALPGGKTDKTDKASKVDASVQQTEGGQPNTTNTGKVSKLRSFGKRGKRNSNDK